MYTSIDAAYRTAGITREEISEEDVKEFILDSEADVDKYTNTTYWSISNKGTATSGGNDTLTDSNGKFLINEFEDDSYLWIYSGTGENQIRKIESNTETQITVDNDWDTNPDTTSKYRIIHTANSPHIQTEYHDGNGTSVLFLEKYPLVLLESAITDSTSVTPSNILQWTETGKLQLSSSAEKTAWSSKNTQDTTINYWFGVYPIPRNIKRLTEVKTAMKMLRAQMGGTHNIPSTYQTPEASVTVGQAYVNIRGTYDVLDKEHSRLLQEVKKYHVFA